jgi:hypothetical protein
MCVVFCVSCVQIGLVAQTSGMFTLMRMSYTHQEKRYDHPATSFPKEHTTNTKRRAQTIILPLHCQSLCKSHLFVTTGLGIDLTSLGIVPPGLGIVLPGPGAPWD